MKSLLIASGQNGQRASGIEQSAGTQQYLESTARQHYGWAPGEETGEIAGQGDRAGAVKLIKGTRFRLGLIIERIIDRRQAGLRRYLLTVSRELSVLEETPVAELLGAWQAGFERHIKPALVKAEPSSFYASASVDRWLRTRR